MIKKILIIFYSLLLFPYVCLASFVTTTHPVASVGDSQVSDNITVGPDATVTGTIYGSPEFVRNSADASPVVTINNQNSGSTGAILSMKWDGSQSSLIDKYGAYVFKRDGPASSNYASEHSLYVNDLGYMELNIKPGSYFGIHRAGSFITSFGPLGQALNGSIYSSANIKDSEVRLGVGTIIRRGYGDSSSALRVQQTSTSSTGNITNFENSSGVATSIGINGAVIFNQVSTVNSGTTEIRNTSTGLNINAGTGKYVMASVAGTNVFTLSNAMYMNKPITNISSVNKGQISFAQDGITVRRNQADGSPVLKVIQDSTTSTDDLILGINSGGTVFGVTYSGNVQLRANSSIVTTANEIARISGNTNYNVPSGQSHLFGVNGGTTFTVSDGGLAYTATANEYFNITASNHTGTDGGIFVALGSSAAEVRGISVENTLNGDYTDSRNFDGYLLGPAAGLTGQAAVYWGEIENSANDVSGSIYSVFRAIDVTDNGGAGKTAVVHGGSNFDFFAVVGSGNILSIDNATFGITAMNGGDVDRNAYDMPFVAESGSDSGAVARNGGSFTFQPGSGVNGGGPGNLKIVQAGGSEYISLAHDGTDSQYNTSTGVHTFNQVVRAKEGVRTKVSTADVSSPPTDAEIDSAFGTPATVGSGWTGIIDDAGAGTAVWMVTSTGSEWWYSQMTEAM